MAPQRIDIKADYICNNNCLFCVIAEDERQKRGIPVAQIKKELAESRKKGALEVSFTGGEPTIRKEILDLVAYAKETGFSTIMLITNGRMLASMEFARRLSDAGANRFMFSIHGLRDTHDQLTRSTGSFDQATQGMKNIKQLGKELVTDTVATKLNYQELPRIVEYLLDVGSSLCQIDFVIPCGNAWKYCQTVVPRLTECVPLIHKTIDEARKKGYDKKILVMGVPYCFMKGYETHMNEPRIPIIKIASPEKDHSTDNYNEHRAEGKRKPEKCRKCEHFQKCEGLWQNYLLLYGESEVNVTK